MDKPSCPSCGALTFPIGVIPPTPEEARWGAGNVESYKCQNCMRTIRFPRYNHPAKLLGKKEIISSVTLVVSQQTQTYSGHRFSPPKKFSGEKKQGLEMHLRLQQRKFSLKHYFFINHNGRDNIGTDPSSQNVA